MTSGTKFLININYFLQGARPCKNWQGKQWNLSGCLSGLECHPAHQKVVDLISGQGACPDCGYNPRLGCIWEATIDPSLSHWCFSSHPSLSFSFSFSLPLSLKSVNNPWMRIWKKNLQPKVVGPQGASRGWGRGPCEFRKAVRCETTLGLTSFGRALI